MIRFDFTKHRNTKKKQAAILSTDFEERNSTGQWEREPNTLAGPELASGSNTTTITTTTHPDTMLHTSLQGFVG